jgi:hypothetical protein
MEIMSSLAESESVSISENNKWGIRHRFENGTFKIAYPPYGYESQDGEMVVNEEEAKWVRWIFEQALSGVASAKIAKQLNEKQVPSRRNGNWTPTTIRGMLTKLRTTDLIRRKRQHPLKTACYKGFCGQGGAFRLMCGAGKRAGMRIGPCTMDTITL